MQNLFSCTENAANESYKSSDLDRPICDLKSPLRTQHVSKAKDTSNLFLVVAFQDAAGAEGMIASGTEDKQKLRTSTHACASNQRALILG